MAQLNQQQRQAVETTEGWVRVIAGAGSGKTRALSHRFAWLVNDLGILPENILCVTFTNKAAAEMRSRIHRLTGDNDTGLITTFHGFCNTVLKEESNAIYYPKSFIVLDNTDIDAMLQLIYEERNLSLRHMTFARAREMIEIQKLFEKPDYYQDFVRFSLEQLHEKYINARDVKDIIFYGYLYQQKKSFSLDYNDLILLTLYIFEENPQIRLKWQQRLEYIMIDEFQDIDGLQYKLMKVLEGFHHNLFVVGDPDQTIYTWRGARIEYLLNFDQDFPQTRTIFLNENYRSTPQILNACNSLIEVNQNRIKKELYSRRPSGPVVQAFMAPDQNREAGFIVEKIRELTRKGYELGDITILYRAHYISRAIEDAFLKEEIPYHIYSGVQFFERAEIKDALSYLRMLVFKDDLSLIRTVNIPKRNIGTQRLKRIKEKALAENCTLYEALKLLEGTPDFAQTGAKGYIDLIDHFQWQNLPVSEILSRMLDRSQYELMLRTQGSQERLDNLAELKQSMHEYEVSCGEEAGLEHYLSHIALYTNTDLSLQGNSVKMMTVHAAKGLEFPVVFLAGMAEGMFPARKVSSLQAMEEERRLAFVAMTRAKDRLYLTHSAGRNFDGSSRFCSRFILDIKPEFREFAGQFDPLLVEDAREFIQVQTRFMQQDAQMSSLQPGDLIEHPAFGRGTILASDPVKKVHLIHFDKLKTERQISFRARLKKIGSQEFSDIMN